MLSSENGKEKHAIGPGAEGQSGIAHEARPQVRSAVRFPLVLPVIITYEGREISAKTRNISSNGVLLVADRAWEPGSPLHFAMRMPGKILGAHQDVMVRCTGRVVRCQSNDKNFEVAATIDEYHFADK